MRSASECLDALALARDPEGTRPNQLTPILEITAYRAKSHNAYGGFLSSRGSDVSEDPVGHLCALLPRRFIRKTEMEAVVDADIDHIGCHVRETIIGARFFGGLRVVAGDCEGHVVLPEEERERAGQRAGDTVGAGGIVGIGRGVQKRLPRGVTGRRRIAVVLALLDGRDRSPKNIVL